MCSDPNGSRTDETFLLLRVNSSLHGRRTLFSSLICIVGLLCCSIIVSKPSCVGKGCGLQIVLFQWIKQAQRRRDLLPFFLRDIQWIRLAPVGLYRSSQLVSGKSWEAVASVSIQASHTQPFFIANKKCSEMNFHLCVRAGLCLFIYLLALFLFRQLRISLRFGPNQPVRECLHEVISFPVEL